MVKALRDRLEAEEYTEHVLVEPLAFSLECFLTTRWFSPRVRDSNSFSRPSLQVHYQLSVCIQSLGKHGGGVNSSSVTALSHISVQVFSNSHSQWFTHIPQKTSQLQTKQFVLLPPRRLLLYLNCAANLNETRSPGNCRMIIWSSTDCWEQQNLLKRRSISTMSSYNVLLHLYK